MDANGGCAFDGEVRGVRELLGHNRKIFHKSDGWNDQEPLFDVAAKGAKAAAALCTATVFRPCLHHGEAQYNLDLTLASEIESSIEPIRPGNVKASSQD
jgi:hypothetical protein